MTRGWAFLTLNLPGEGRPILAARSGTGMIRGDGSRVSWRDKVSMRCQGQQQRVSTLKIHPLERFRIAGIARLDGDLACLSFPAYRNVFPILCLKCDASAPTVHDAEGGGLFAAHGL